MTGGRQDGDASADQNRFMRDVAGAVDEVVIEFGGDLE